MLIRQETNYLGKDPDHAQLTTIIGMMGAGKSKLGYIVSKSLNVNFYDIDDLIEKELNTSIKELFKSHGEAYFRRVEEAKIEIEELIETINKEIAYINYQIQKNKIPM